MQAVQTIPYKHSDKYNVIGKCRDSRFIIVAPEYMFVDHDIIIAVAFSEYTDSAHASNNNVRASFQFLWDSFSKVCFIPPPSFWNLSHWVGLCRCGTCMWVCMCACE